MKAILDFRWMAADVLTQESLIQAGCNYEVLITMSANGVSQTFRIGAEYQYPGFANIEEAVTSIVAVSTMAAEDYIGCDFDEVEDSVCLQLRGADGKTVEVESNGETIAEFIYRLITAVAIAPLERQH